MGSLGCSRVHTLPLGWSGVHITVQRFTLCLRSILLGMAVPAVQPRSQACAVRGIAAGCQGMRQRNENRHLAGADPAAVLRVHYAPQVRCRLDMAGSYPVAQQLRHVPEQRRQLSCSAGRAYSQCGWFPVGFTAG